MRLVRLISNQWSKDASLEFQLLTSGTGDGRMGPALEGALLNFLIHDRRDEATNN